MSREALQLSGWLPRPRDPQSDVSYVGKEGQLCALMPVIQGVLDAPRKADLP